MEGKIISILGDSRVNLRVKITSRYVAFVDFTYFKIRYTFEIKKWSGKGLAMFASLFHGHTKRDSELFGYVNEEGILTANMNQKASMVLQGINDVMTAVSLIIVDQGRCVLDYAVWYCEHTDYMVRGYKSYITKIACHCIVHSNFQDGTAKYEMTEFV
jgi:hypothetical protein